MPPRVRQWLLIVLALAWVASIPACAEQNPGTEAPAPSTTADALAGSSEVSEADLEAFRRRAFLCFAPGGLKKDAGELAAGGISPRDARRVVRSAVGPSVRARLSRARRISPAGLAGAVDRVEVLARQGMAQLRADPELLDSAEVPGFSAAQDLLERAGIARC